MSSAETHVIKFGSSVLRTAGDLDPVAERILSIHAEGKPVVCVVSAFDGATEELIAEANANRLRETTADFAAAVAQGEFESAKALTRNVRARGGNARMMSPKEIEFLALGPRCDAWPAAVDENLIEAAICETPVIIVPGFSAVDNHGDFVLLGRGGSDLTAIEIAHALSVGRAHLVKDVDGVYNRDPNKHPDARRMSFLDYRAALSICGDLIQDKALVCAEKRRVDVLITSLENDQGTLISSCN